MILFLFTFERISIYLHAYSESDLITESFVCCVVLWTVLHKHSILMKR